MARKQYRSTARSLRDDSEQVPATMPTLHRLWVGVLLDLCMHAGYGVYLGKWGVSGKVTVRFYVEDDASETFLKATDNPAEWFATTAKHFFSAGLIEEAMRVGAARIASEAAGAAKKA